ncbi:hypothetical protein FHS15_003766 [Paenibacillus castaneae]|uniref:NHLP leader peptide family RiPP precursor n=1 Tax=Paenibacillus castaneae TaxID=474957 RepID=UPI000C9A0B4F|nr:NHLP leader peptide family RiPP precursor [Paenibacillus castaneae]NIK78620.1 hypothetical protein [Paenibacillus castaneae]
MSEEQNVQDKIIKKAWEDAEFKKQLLANPKAAVKEAFGIEVPDTIEVEVVEESANKFYFVLPQQPSKLKVTDESEVLIPRWTP